MVSHDSTDHADAMHRVQLAMNAYAPLADRLFGSPQVACDMKLAFSSLLVESRLFYNVHLWSTMQVSALKKLNGVYMRVLRKIADRCRFDASAISDVSVRVQLCALSIDCIFRTRRLLYAARLARNGHTSLKGLLDSKVK